MYISIVYSCIIIFFAGLFITSTLFIESILRRRKQLQNAQENVPEQVPSSDKIQKTKRAYLSWHFILAVSLITHSLLSTSPEYFQHRDGEDIGSRTLMFLELDKLVLINSIHGVFVIGASFRFVETRKAHYWWFTLTPHLMVLMTVTVSVVLNCILLSRFGPANLIQTGIAMFQWITSFNCLVWSSRMKCWIKHEEFDRIRVSVNDIEGPTNRVKRLQKQTYFFMLLDIAWFGLYNIALLAIRIPEAIHAKEPPPIEEFCIGLIEGYTTALHRSVIIGFGIHGALDASSSPLQYYWLGTSLFAVLSFFELIPTFGMLFNNAWMVIPFLLLLSEVAIKVGGSLCANQLISMLIPRWDNSPTKDTDLADASEQRFSFTAIYTVSFIVWWFVECLVFVGLQLFSNHFMLFDLAATAFNFGLHGNTVFLLANYRSHTKTSYEKTGARIRFYMTFYAMFAMLGLVEFINSSIAYFKGEMWNDWGLLTFMAVTAMRFIIAALAVNAFRVVGVENMIAWKKQRETENGETLDEKEDTTKDLLLENKAPSSLLNEPKPVVVDIVKSQQLQEMHLSESALEKTELWLKAFGSAFLVFGIFLVLTPSAHTNYTGYRDFLGLIGSHSGISCYVITDLAVAQIGDHVSAYGVLYHFCLIVVGYAMLGVRHKLNANIQFFGIVARGIMLVGISAIISCIGYSILHPLDVDPDIFVPVQVIGITILIVIGVTSYYSKQRLDGMNFTLWSMGVYNTSNTW